MSTPSNITIQINNLAALERLLGGDSALEVSLRDSVAAKFADEHMMGLIKSKIEATDVRLKDAIAREVDKTLLVQNNRTWNGVQLSTQAATEVAKKVHETIDAKMNELRASMLHRIDEHMTSIRQQVDVRLPQLVEVAIGRDFQSKVSAAVAAKLVEVRRLLATQTPQ